MKTHSKYSYEAKNYGKDLIYKKRLELAKKLKISMYKTKSPFVWNYLCDAYNGIILQ